MAGNRDFGLVLIPLFLAIHNAEEAFMYPRYLPTVRDRAPFFMRELARTADPKQLYMALLIATFIPAMVLLWYILRPQSVAAVWLLLVTQATVFINVAAHVSSALFLFHGYGPGLATAVAVNLPFSIFLFKRVAREQWITRRQAAWILLAALAVHGPGLVGIIAIAGYLAR